MKRFSRELLSLFLAFGALAFTEATDSPVYATPTASLRLNGVKFPDGSNAQGGVFNVKAPEYNALGNGTGDDAAAIQAAINAAPSGGTVSIPPGTYNLVGSGTEILLINKPIFLSCSSGFGTILQVASTVPGTRDVIHVTAPSANVGLRIRDCVIATVNASGVSITGATNATPISITATAHGYSTGQTVTVASVGGNTNANGTWVITKVDNNTFTLNGSVGNAAYTSGGTAAAVPGRHAINLDVTAGNSIQNVKIEHNWIQQLGGRAINVTNTAPIQNGVYLVDVRDNILRGGVNLANAGDSLLFKGNTISGGFNAFDVALVQGVGNPAGGGAHLLVIEDNNVTSQGCFVHVTNGSQIRILNNNVEPGFTGGSGIDTSNCSNGAVMDLDGNTTTPSYQVQVRGNFVTNWTNNGSNGNIARVNWTVGAVFEHNDFSRVSAGPFSYVATSNAVGTRFDIPATEDGAITATLVSDAGTRTWTRFLNPDGSEEFGSTTSKSYRLRIRGGSAQSGDIFNVLTNGGSNIIEADVSGNLRLAGAADNGYPFHVGGPAYFDARVQAQHIVGVSSTPTNVIGVGCSGCGTPTVTGTDITGSITLVPTGTGTASAIVDTVTFNVAYLAAPYCSITPANAAASALSGTAQLYVDKASTTTGVFVIKSGSTALPAGTYIYVYECGG